MSKSCSFELDEGGVLQLGGELTFGSAPDVYRMADQRIADGGRLTVVDLSGVSRADSAGLALLLEWQARRAGSGNEPLRFTNAPDSLIRLAQLSEAVELLNLAGRGHPL